jgi:hypothetical protein
MPAAPHPIYAQLRERAAKRQQSHDRKVFSDACKEVAAHMDGIGFAELYKSEVPEQLSQSWGRIWNYFWVHLKHDPHVETIEFKIKGVSYWLTRDF